MILSYRDIIKFQVYGPDYCCIDAAPAMWLTALQVANIVRNGNFLCDFVGYIYSSIFTNSHFRTWLPSQSSLKLARLGDPLDVPLDMLGVHLSIWNTHLSHLNRWSYFICSIKIYIISLCGEWRHKNTPKSIPCSCLALVESPQKLLTCNTCSSDPTR